MAKVYAIGSVSAARRNTRLAALSRYEIGQSAKPLRAVERLIRETQDRPELKEYLESRLADVLRSDATLDAKSFICKAPWLVSISTVGAYVKDKPYGQKILDCANTIKKVVPEGSLLVTSMEDEIALQYYSDRVGWPFVVNRKAHKQRFRDSAFITSFELDHRKAFENFLTKGANYYANCDLKNLNNYPQFKEFLSSRFEKVYYESGKLVIFKL